MNPLDQLPADQRAVLELVLARGRNYDQIAQMLSIDRAGVRERALAAFDTLGPQTNVAAESRALITDYLLGQLPGRLSEVVRDRLAREPTDRAWARVIASELTPVASGPLPEIPAAHDDAEGHDSAPAAPAPAAPAPAAAGRPEGTAEAAEEGSSTPSGSRAGTPAAAASAGPRGAIRPGARSSRRGGALLLGVGGLIVVAVIVVVLAVALGGGSSKSSSSGSQSAASSSKSGTPPILATVRLTPTQTGSNAQGVAEAFAQGGKQYLAIVAVNLQPNKNNYYAVWLSNGAGDSRLLGFANPGVGSNGRLQAATQLQSTDRQFKTLLLTVETQSHPTTPGPTVLSGAFNLK